MTVDEAKQIMMNTPIQVERYGDTIKVSKEYPSLVGGKWYSIERTILQGGDPIHELIAIERQLDDAFELSQRYATEFHPTNPPIPMKTINREYERKSIEIENVSSLEELAQFKEYCGKNPDLMTAYTNKLRELTNKIKV